MFFENTSNIVLFFCRSKPLTVYLLLTGEVTGYIDSTLSLSQSGDVLERWRKFSVGCDNCTADNATNLFRLVSLKRLY